MTTQEIIIDVLRGINRPGIEDLINHIEAESDFFKAPCTSQDHNCKEGGLAQHSLEVYMFAGELYLESDYIKQTDSDEINEESIRIVALLHDIGKATYHGKPNYVPNILKGGKLSESKPYEVNKNRLTIPHEVVSLQIASRFIELTEEEEFAILYHNGLYVGLGREISGKERPLQQLLHFADMWCSRFGISGEVQA